MRASTPSSLPRARSSDILRESDGRKADCIFCPSWVCLLAFSSAGTPRSTARPLSSRTARRRSARPPARPPTRAGSSTRAVATGACTLGACRTSGPTVAVKGGVGARRRRVSCSFLFTVTLSAPPLIAELIFFVSELASQTSSCTCSPSSWRSRPSRRTTIARTAARRPSTSRTRSSSSGPTRRSSRGSRARIRWCWLRLGRSRQRRSARGYCFTVCPFLLTHLSLLCPFLPILFVRSDLNLHPYVGRALRRRLCHRRELDELALGAHSARRLPVRPRRRRQQGPHPGLGDGCVGLAREG